MSVRRHNEAVTCEEAYGFDRLQRGAFLDLASFSKDFSFVWFCMLRKVSPVGVETEETHHRERRHPPQSEEKGQVLAEGLGGVLRVEKVFDRDQPETSYGMEVSDEHLEELGTVWILLEAPSVRDDLVNRFLFKYHGKWAHFC